MILYFKHIIHIDDFPLKGHPPSLLLYGIMGMGRLMLKVMLDRLNLQAEDLLGDYYPI